MKVNLFLFGHTDSMGNINFLFFSFYFLENLVNILSAKRSDKIFNLSGAWINSSKYGIIMDGILIYEKKFQNSHFFSKPFFTKF